MREAATFEVDLKDSADDATEWVVRRIKAPTNAKSERDAELLQARIGRPLPVGFPFVVDDISGAIAELVLFYLYEKHYKERASMFVPNKLRDYAFDSKDWLNYLDFMGIVWHQATVNDLENYVDAMQATISPTSGEEYSNATPRRRVSTIEGLYQWARERNAYVGALPENALLLPIDSGASVENGTSRWRVKVPFTAKDNEPVHVMQFEQARAIMTKLGPLPREVVANGHHGQVTTTKSASLTLNVDMRSSRDRLPAEYGLNVGLRISEIRNLNCSKFKGYNARSIIENKNYPLRVMGKGSKGRTVDVPGWLILETICYIEGERESIIASIEAISDVDALFINPPSAYQHAGKRVSVRTLERRFADACIEAGNWELEERTSIRQQGAELVLTKFHAEKPLFVFHDLRHTYAVWTYYFRHRTGEEAWLYIQAQLGHANLKTTLDKYLKVTNRFEAAVSDGLMRYLNEKR